MKVNVYRFGDRAALTVIGDDGGTVYFSPTMAGNISRALKEIKEDCERVSFPESELKTYTFDSKEEAMKKFSLYYVLPDGEDYVNCEVDATSEEEVLAMVPPGCTNLSILEIE